MKSNIRNKKQDSQKTVLESSDGKTLLSAIHTPYHHLSEEDIIRFKEREAAVSNKVECLLNEYLDEADRPLSKRKSAS